MAPAIDVWDLSTFDQALIAFLDQHAQLIFSYLARDREIFLAHDLGRSRTILRPENPYASAFLAVKEAAQPLMEQRTIRAYHYTRLTNDEVASLRAGGIELSTPESLRRRFDRLVAAGEIAPEIANALLEKSPFQSDQREARKDKFWMTSHPFTIDDGGVEPLLKHWGGEAASMWVREPELLGTLAKLGRARVLEMAVPLNATRHGYLAGEAVIATFARARGATPSKHAFDLYVRHRLPPENILAVHSAGDDAFQGMGRTYPAGFVDVDMGRWKELTGEDE